MNNHYSTHCKKCGQHVNKMAERGAWLERTSPKGGPFEGVCAPSCEHKHGDQNDALIGAIEGPETAAQEGN